MRKVRLPLGPVVLDVAGLALTDDDRERLRHPAAGGVILFARNYETPEQLAALDATKSRSCASPSCRSASTTKAGACSASARASPASRRCASSAASGTATAKRRTQAARAAAYVIGAELGAHGVDFSFTPVLDLDYGASSVIGDRALHFDPNAVGALAAALIQGFADAGMARGRQAFPGPRLRAGGFAPRRAARRAAARARS